MGESMNLSVAWVLFGAAAYVCGATNGQTHIGGEIFGTSVALIATLIAIFSNRKNKREK